MYYILSKRQPDGLLEFEEFSSLNEARPICMIKEGYIMMF